MSPTGEAGRAVQAILDTVRDLLGAREVVIEPAGAAPSESGELAVPLPGASGGVLVVRGQPGRNFEARDVRLAGGFAAQAGAALEAGRRLRTLARLNLLGTSQSQSRVLTAVTRAAVTLMEARIASLWSADEQARTLDLVAASDVHFLAEFPIRRVRFGEGGVGWAAEHRERVVVDFRERDERLILSDWFLERGLTAALVVPIFYRHALLGVLAVGSDRPFRLSRDDEALLGGFVAQAATAIAHARLFRAARRRRREAEVLATLAHSIGASLDLGTVLQRAVEGARELCRADSARIALREDDADVLTLRYFVGHRTRRFERVQVRPGQGLGGQVLLTGRPVRTDDWAGDPRFTKGDYGGMVVDEGIVCQMAAPVVIAGRIDGLLYVDRRVARPFTQREQALLVRVAGYAALAIANGRLFAGEQQARREAETARARYRSLFDGVPVGLLRTRPDGTIVDANQAIATMLRCPDRDTLLATNMTDLWVEAGRREAWRTAVERDGVVLDWEERLRRRDGSVAWVVSSFSVVRDDAGRVLYYDGVLEDITPQKEAQEALRQSQKMEAIGRLAGGVAHDFNNLLTVIAGRAELLRDLVDSDRAREHADLIVRTAERGSALTRQLLAFSSRQALRTAGLDLDQTVGEMATLLRRLIGEDIHLELTSSGRGAWVLADRAQVEQVVVNLAVNARDAMPEGGRVTIAIEPVDLDAPLVGRHARVPAGRWVRLAVADTGHGMDAATLERVFEPFFTTKAPGKGTGLGLSTVYGIVQQSGGRVLVASTPAAGTTFDVYLPRVEPPAAHGAAPAQGAPALRRGSETILLVEDNDDVRTIAREMLERAGYAVVATGQPKEAAGLAGAHPGPVHLLLTDVVMPGLSGGEVARHVRAACPDVRVLFMSGHADDMLVLRGVQDQRSGFLGKPFTRNTLLAKVREALDG